MDQSIVLALFANFYDTLVADVADRVMSKLENKLGDELIDARIKNWVTFNFDDCANAWAEDAFDSLAENWADNNLDLEDVAREAIQNSHHLTDLIRDTVRSDLTFSISVD